MQFTRRDWIAGSLGAAAWAEIAAAQQHAHDAVKPGATARLVVLQPEAAREVEAITSQILPSDDGPGAREAGVVYFIDRALATFDADKKQAYHAGLEEIAQTRRKLFPDSTSFHGLPSADQMAVVRAIEKSEFFEVLRTHTLLGFLGNPSYGGNRGQVGWKHIGFENRMAWEPPFGYYDAAAAKGEAQ